MRHHTIDPEKRAEHVADGLQRQREKDLAAQGRSPYTNWPEHWLEVHSQVLEELQPIINPSEDAIMDIMRVKRTEDRSSLYGKKCQLLGFGFMQHPEKTGWKLQAVFYRTLNPIPEYVICLSDVKKEDPRSTQEMRKNLGTTVPGELIAPYAQRSLLGERLTYPLFCQTMVSAFPEVKIEWWKE